MMDFARITNGRTLLTLNLIGDTTMILFKILKNMNKEMKEAYGKYYAYPVITKTVDIDGLAKQMAAYNTGFSEGQVKGMLADMVKRIKENITNGFAVKIDDLAIFTCGIVNKEGAADKAKFSVAANIESIKLRARATGELTRANLNREASLMDIEKLANLSGAGTENGTPGDTPGGGTTDPGDKKDEENKNPGGTGSEGTGSEGTGSEGTGSEGTGSDSGHVNL